MCAPISLFEPTAKADTCIDVLGTEVAVKDRHVKAERRGGGMYLAI